MESIKNKKSKNLYSSLTSRFIFLIRSNLNFFFHGDML